MAALDDHLIPTGLAESFLKPYRTLYQVKRENDAHKIRPQWIVVITDLAKDYDDLLALVLYKELHRIGLVKLKGVVANLMPAEKRAAFGRGALNLLGLQNIPIAFGTSGLPGDSQIKVNEYEFDCPFMVKGKFKEGHELLYQILTEAEAAGESIVILCLSSLKDINIFTKQHPQLFCRIVEKVVLQGGYTVRDGNLVASRDAANNKFDFDAAQNFHTFLQDNKIPSMVFDRTAAFGLKTPLRPAMFTDMAATGNPIGQHLVNTADRQETVFFNCAIGPPEGRFGYLPKGTPGMEEGREGLGWVRYRGRTRWEERDPPATYDKIRPFVNVTAYDALPAAGVMGDKAMERLRIIDTPKVNWPATIHQVVGDGTEPGSLVGTGEGMCITLEALLRGSLLAVQQGLSSSPG